MAKAKNPRIVEINSSNVLGTSRQTTSNVTAKAKTASEKLSIRETSSPRQENPSSPASLGINLLRSTSSRRPCLDQSFSCSYRMVQQRLLGGPRTRFRSPLFGKKLATGA